MYHLPDLSASAPASIGKAKGSSKSKSHSHSHSHSHHNSLTHTHHNSLSLSSPSSAPSHPSQQPQPDPTKGTSTYPKVQTRAKDRTLFNAAVLELVKLIQAALAISGMFPLHPHAYFLHRGHHHHHRPLGEIEMDGLLCDVTVEGIQKWVSEIGENCVGVEVSLGNFSLCGCGCLGCIEGG